MLNFAQTVFANGWTVVILLPGVVFASGEPPIEYNRDVRPLLAEKCFRCHGPDASARQAGLRLDEPGTMLREADRAPAIDPGNPANSEVIRRIVSLNPHERMPPPDSGSAKLTAGETQLLRQWIREGARYQAHWAFVPPRRPIPPVSADDRWSRSPIDRFVMAKLQRAGWTPSVEAEPATLIRRVTLDLTGLPPSVAEVERFEHACREHKDVAYRRLVDRLLSSPCYGEQMAVGWLDAARYADTNGYFTDNERTMWVWRDWVIAAFNASQPFDEFTVDQLAGDLLVEEQPMQPAADPAHGAAMARRIATGFNRNHMVNNETGIIEEEFRVEYVVDRIDTTATVWMGLTLGCARCHDHKYDPISQREFYQFYAFFNQLAERGLSGSGGNSVPLLRVPGDEQVREAESLDRAVAAAEARFAASEQARIKAQQAWEATALATTPPPDATGLAAHFGLDGPVTGAATCQLIPRGTISYADGMLDQAAQFTGDGWLEAAGQVDLARGQPFSVSAWVFPKGAGCVISKIDDANQMRGLDISLRKGKLLVSLVNQWNRNAIQVASRGSVASGRWHHLLVTYDGSHRASGVRIYLDGQSLPVAVHHDHLTGSIQNDQPLRIGRRQASASYTGLIDDVRIYDRQLEADEGWQLHARQLVRGLVARPPERRSAAQQQLLRTWFLRHHADARHATAARELDDLRARRQRLLKDIPTTMIMEDADESRSTFVLLRGQYDQPGEVVTAGVPAFLDTGAAAPASSAEMKTRLDLARWLVHPSHPLTARVTVNRLWQQLFGTGIVKTVDDFGTQGDWPSHPRLLDWLAVELIEGRWDLKRLLRSIVLSATYRQSSQGTRQQFQIDPENRLLARGPSYRLPAEALRDNALSISGLLVERLGGPSVKPYQPAGLWEAVTYDSDARYLPSSGANLYRRSLYTYWKRQAPPPNLLAFDATTRETCTVTRSRTNTPLQALVLMNDPTFIEAARHLAAGLLRQPVDDDDTQDGHRMRHAFRAATARRPRPDELAVLLGLLREQRREFLRYPERARQLLQVGSSESGNDLDKAELAAWSTVTSVILSLDETITKP